MDLGTRFSLEANQGSAGDGPGLCTFTEILLIKLTDS
jgi:hypothetical protein